MAKIPLRLPDDFVDLLTEFERASVRYVVLGGYAVGFHDRPRTTKDLDLLIDPSERNVERATVALAAFGAPPSVLQDFRTASSDEIVWLGVPPLRIDLLRAADGVDFRSCYARRVRVTIGSLEANVIGLDDLIATKRAANRPQDRADVSRLLRVRSRKAAGVSRSKGAPVKLKGRRPQG
jgi:predicted nucleotidyltransferase